MAAHLSLERGSFLLYEKNYDESAVQASPLTLTVLGQPKSVAVRGELPTVPLVSKHFLFYEGPIGGSEKCGC